MGDGQIEDRYMEVAERIVVLVGIDAAESRYDLGIPRSENGVGTKYETQAEAAVAFGSEELAIEFDRSFSERFFAARGDLAVAIRLNPGLLQYADQYSTLPTRSSPPPH